MKCSSSTQCTSTYYGSTYYTHHEVLVLHAVPGAREAKPCRLALGSGARCHVGLTLLLQLTW